MRNGYDCHLHVIDPMRFPYPGGPGYLPGDEEKGDAALLRRTFEEHNMTGALLVQPSTYGTDNSCMLDAMARSGGTYRGIAVIPPTIKDDELDRLEAAGVVGIRLNTENLGTNIIEAAVPLLPRLVERGWYIQILLRAARLPAFMKTLTTPLTRSGRSKLIFDHLGLFEVDRGIDDPGFREVLRCGREGIALVKLSGAFRVSQQPYPYPDLDPFIDQLLEAFGIDHCVFGSDWPFFGDVKPPYAQTLAMLEHWLPDDQARNRVLIENPKKLFGLP